jgi:hypothetical protein
MLETASVFRRYDRDRDLDAVRRIWRESGWLGDGSERRIRSMDAGMSACRCHVAELHGEAECFVANAMGRMKYLEADLHKSFVCAVNTSHVARKQGLAGRLTAHSIAQDVADGAIVAGLGIFDQGYYDRLGFATGPYMRRMRFDPAHLLVPRATRVPQRLSVDDYRQVQANREMRLRRHGGLVIDHHGHTLADMNLAIGGFGLGFVDNPDGSLSHHLWMSSNHTEHGPYFVHWCVFQTMDQFRELMGVLRNLDDQVHGVRMADPPGIQLQALLRVPFRQRSITANGDFDTRMESFAHWQLRICDLPACVSHMKAARPLRFNLTLRDPIAEYLPDDAPWRGVAGDYVITLDDASGAERGRDPSLPTMHTTVNAFSRLWFGVQPATTLRATTDAFEAPDDLCAQLDAALPLPMPCTDWDY